MKRKVPDVLLERLLLNELPKDKARQVLENLKKERGGMDRLENLRKSNRKILRKYPAPLMASGIKKRYKEQKRQNFLFKIKRYFTARPVPAPAFGLALALIIFIIFPQLLQRFPVDEGIRIKGGTELGIYLKTGEKEIKLRPNDRVKQGDIVQLTYKAGDAGFGVIFSIDGRGSVTLHYPASRKDPPRLEPGKKQILKEAFQLDDAPQYEHFFFVASEKKIDAREVLGQASRLRRTPEKIKTEFNRLFKKIIVIELRLNKE